MTQIPWQDKLEWRKQIKVTSGHIKHLLNDDVQFFGEIVESITHAYREVDECFAVIQSETCGGCFDVCCERATVWYDFRDVLYFCALGGCFPDSQLFRIEGGMCSNLTLRGCCVERQYRPYVCSWYICSLQNTYLEQNKMNAPGYKKHLQTLLKDIQIKRKVLERLYISVYGETTQK